MHKYPYNLLEMQRMITILIYKNPENEKTGYNNKATWPRKVRTRFEGKFQNGKFIKPSFPRIYDARFCGEFNIDRGTEAFIGDWLKSKPVVRVRGKVVKLYSWGMC